MTYEEQLKIQELNKQIINNILEKYSKEEINNYYFEHTRPECLTYFGLRTEKQLLKLLKLTEYDFNLVKPTLKNYNKLENQRSHESYVLGGKKSAETQKQHWAEKSEEDKQAWSDKMTEAHSSKEFKEKIKKINIDRFTNMSAEEKLEYSRVRSEANKKRWITDRENILAKAYHTRTENNTFNSSKPEEDYYMYLITKYGEADIFRQYVDKRYPFKCDFYIKSLDLFIELNLSWTHGFREFDENDKECLAMLDSWKEKALTSDYYKKAIYTWTDLDVRKRKAAIENNLNYIIYYYEDELYD